MRSRAVLATLTSRHWTSTKRTVSLEAIEARHQGEKRQEVPAGGFQRFILQRDPFLLRCRMRPYEEVLDKELCGKRDEAQQECLLCLGSRPTLGSKVCLKSIATPRMSSAALARSVFQCDHDHIQPVAVDRTREISRNKVGMHSTCGSIK